MDPVGTSKENICFFISLEMFSTGYFGVSMLCCNDNLPIGWLLYPSVVLGLHLSRRQSNHLKVRLSLSWANLVDGNQTI